MRGTSDTPCAPRLSVMDAGGGLLQIEDCHVISLIDRNIANVGDSTAVP